MHRIQGTNVATDSNGNFIFTEGPPGTTVTAAWLNSVQEEIANVITSAGINLNGPFNDSNTQLESAIRRIATEYDYIVSSQNTFNALFERTGANTYKINDNYKSIYIKELTGGYQVSGILSGGDTYADISTNLCELIYCMPGSYWDFENTRGYLNVNTANCTIFNMDIQGSGTVASAIPQSYLLAAAGVAFYNCRSSSRLSNAGAADYFAVFRGGTAAQNRTSKYIGCVVENCEASGAGNQIYGFKDCYNMVACRVENLDADGPCVGIMNCRRVSNFTVYDIVSSGGYAAGIYSTAPDQCHNISTGIVQTVTSSAGAAFGVAGVNAANPAFAISNLYVDDIETSNPGSSAFGMYFCDNVSSCFIGDIDKTHASAGSPYGLYECKQITGCEIYQLDTTGTGSVYGLFNCDNVSSCEIHDLDSTSASIVGMNGCNNISGCYIHDLETSFAAGEVYGMDTCKNISGCEITDLIANGGDIYGLDTCAQISSTYVHTIVATVVGSNFRAFFTCSQLSGCHVESFTGSNSTAAHLFDTCKGVTGCTVKTIVHDSTLNCFVTCERLSACTIDEVDVAAGGDTSGFKDCFEMSACLAYDIINTGNGDVYAFQDCDQITGCRANQIDSNNNGPCMGFYQCDRITGCYANDIDADNDDASGFNDCDYVSGCFANAINSVGGNDYGFKDCTYISSSNTAGAANNTGNDYVCSADAGGFVPSDFSCSDFETA